MAAVAACVTASDGPRPPATVIVEPVTAPSTTPPSAVVSPPPAEGEIDTGDLVDPEVMSVTVDGRGLLVALADTPRTRSRGLMEVDDLGDLDGMLFDLGSERPVAFTMRNTLIPLTIYFFDESGQGVGRLEMLPCEAEPCPTYSIDAPARYALEVPAGSVDLGDRPTLELP